MCLFTDKTKEFLIKTNCTEINVDEKSIRKENGEWWGYSLPNGDGWMKMQGLGFDFERALIWLMEKPESTDCGHGYKVWEKEIMCKICKNRE